MYLTIEQWANRREARQAPHDGGYVGAVILNRCEAVESPKEACRDGLPPRAQLSRSRGRIEVRHCMRLRGHGHGAAAACASLVEREIGMRQSSFVVVVLTIALAAASFVSLVDARLAPTCPVSIGDYGIIADR